MYFQCLHTYWPINLTFGILFIYFSVFILTYAIYSVKYWILSEFIDLYKTNSGNHFLLQY